MKTICIYHANCLDGLASASMLDARYSNVEFIPMNYSDEPPAAERVAGAMLYILDFSVKPEVLADYVESAEYVVFLDHHKTAAEQYGEGVVKSPKMYQRIDQSKSGCILTCDYFHSTPSRLFQHIDDRDRWQWKLADTAAVTEALWYYNRENLAAWAQADVEQLISEGNLLLKAKKQRIDAAVKTATPVRLGSEHGLMVNASTDISEIGHELATISETFGMVWSVKAGGLVTVSLRSNGLDVSAIAKSFGGGGHKSAAGFTVTFREFVALSSNAI